jgi:release factor glutamine methyltransferase
MMSTNVILPRGKGIRMRYTTKVYSPRYSAIDTIVLADIYVRKGMKVLDVACGSGIVALAVKKLNPDVKVYASDIDMDALRITRYNAYRLGLDLETFQNDLLKKQTGYDMIITNLPTYDKEDMENYKLYGPRVAYYADEKDSMKLYKRFFKQANKALNEDGIIIAECQKRVQEEFLAVARAAGFKMLNHTDNSFAFIRK